MRQDLQVVFEEISLRVSRVYAPPEESAPVPISNFGVLASLPVVDEDVEYAQQCDEETSAPLCLEPNSHHDTSSQSDDRDNNTSERP